MLLWSEMDLYCQLVGIWFCLKFSSWHLFSHSWYKMCCHLGFLARQMLNKERHIGGVLLIIFGNAVGTNFFFFLIFIFISWRLITLQYCSGFCQTLKWISHGFTCSPHPDPPSNLPLHPIPLGLPSAPGLSTCLMHPTLAGDLFHPSNIHVSMLFSWNIPPSPSPTESKILFYIFVSLFLFCI